jgi:hypothetical protein
MTKTPLGLLIILFVFKENTFTAQTIEVEAEPETTGETFCRQQAEQKAASVGEMEFRLFD